MFTFTLSNKKACIPGCSVRNDKGIKQWDLVCMDAVAQTQPAWGRKVTSSPLVVLSHLASVADEVMSKAETSFF